MATHLLSRTVPKTLTLSSSFLSRSLSTAASSARSRPASLINRLRPLAGTIVSAAKYSPSAAVRCFATNATTSSLRDQNPNWQNRPPKETILLDGCDFNHWLVVVEPPSPDLTRDQIIDIYVKTLAQVLGSEEEARMKIYSVSTKCYFAFGALVDEETSYKIKDLTGVRWVLPDSYLDVRNKDYGGEPFVNGQAVPYDPKYHEEWIRNNSRANERNKRNDRPRNVDNSRSFDRRRENMQNRGDQIRRPPPNQPGQGVGPNMAENPKNMPPPHQNRGPNYNNMQQPNVGAPNYNTVQQPHNNYNNMQQPNVGAPNYNTVQQPHNNHNNMQQPSNNWGGAGQPNNYNQMSPSNMRAPPPPQYNMGGPPSPPNMGVPPPPQYNMGGPPSPPNNMGPPPPPPYNSGQPQSPPNMEGRQPAPAWSDPAQYQNNYTPNSDNGAGPNTY